MNTIQLMTEEVLKLPELEKLQVQNRILQERLNSIDFVVDALLNDLKDIDLTIDNEDVLSPTLWALRAVKALFEY